MKDANNFYRILTKELHCIFIPSLSRGNVSRYPRFYAVTELAGEFVYHHAIAPPHSIDFVVIQSEPKRLLSEADRLNEELDSLVMDNYRVFIDNLTCSVFLRNEVR